MKCFERIVLCHLKKQTDSHLDQFQFAYKKNRGTNDATLTLLHNLYTHLEKPNSFARVLFIDFSSAFNTIQPHLMAQKLSNLYVNPRLILWIIDFLFKRVQTVRYFNSNSVSRSTCTGAPQGTVLSPILFTLYTNDCSGTSTTPLIKYSDDSALVDLSNSDQIYFHEVERFATWCKQNFLELNVSKTKEMVIDFRKDSKLTSDLYIDNVQVERVTEYRHLGTILDNHLNFKTNTNSIHQKCQSRVYCLQKLRSLNVNHKVMQTFYRSCIESVLTFSFLCWYSRLGASDRHVLNTIVNVCSKVIGVRLSSLNTLFTKRIEQKATKIYKDNTHVLSKNFELLPSGRRFRVPKTRTVRTRSSFSPTAINYKRF